MQQLIIGHYFVEEKDAWNKAKELKQKTGSEYSVVGFKQNRHPYSPVTRGGYIVYKLPAQRERQTMIQ